MITDSFESHTISLILSWLFAAPFFLFLAISVPVSLLVTKDKNGESPGIGPRAFMVWVAVCAIALSPLRYLLLQSLLFETFFVQSFSAALTSCLYIIPIGVAFIPLSAIGLALPFGAIVWTVGSKEPVSRMRMTLGALIAPLLFYAGSVAFFWLLPYAALSTHWLRAGDMMRATNGPAEYFSDYVVDVDIPYLPNHITINAGGSAKERLREHLCAIYLGRKARRVVTIKHFNKSFEYNGKAVELTNRGSGFFKTIEAEDYEKMKEFRKAALKEAEKVDIEILNDRFDGLGDHYRDECIVGMRKLVEGDETLEDQMLVAGNMKLLEGYRLLDQWGEWYTAHQDEIYSEK